MTKLNGLPFYNLVCTLVMLSDTCTRTHMSVIYLCTQVMFRFAIKNDYNKISKSTCVYVFIHTFICICVCIPSALDK